MKTETVTGWIGTRRPPKFFVRHARSLVDVAASKAYQEGTHEQRVAMLEAAGFTAASATYSLLKHGENMRAIWLDNLRLGVACPKWIKDGE